MTKTAIQWAIVSFKLLAGTGAALLAFVGLIELMGSRAEASRKALIVSFILVVLAGISVLFQVGKPESIMRVFTRISLESPFSWELLSYGAVVVVSLAYLLFARSNKALVKLLAVLALIVAVAFGFSSGYSHVSMPGMPSWHTPAMAACFLLSALLMGGFCYLLICKKKEDEKGYSVVVKAVIVLAVLATISYIVYGCTADLLEYAVIYWIAVPLLGGAASACSALLLNRKGSEVWLYTGFVTALIGSVAMRSIVWVIVETGLSSGNIIHI